MFSSEPSLHQDVRWLHPGVPNTQNERPRWLLRLIFTGQSQPRTSVSCWKGIVRCRTRTTSWAGSWARRLDRLPSCLRRSSWWARPQHLVIVKADEQPVCYKWWCVCLWRNNFIQMKYVAQSEVDLLGHPLCRSVFSLSLHLFCSSHHLLRPL